MSYTHTTQAAAKTILKARLDDASGVFYTDTEIGYAIVEALRMWNAITGHDRASGTFNTSAGTVFYDLSSVLVDGAAAKLRDRTVRDRRLVEEIQYHLIEAVGATSWTGTDQFTLPQILGALQRRRDQFLAETACVVAERTDNVTGGGTGLVTFPDTVIGIRRAVYHTSEGRYFSLRPSDERTAVSPAVLWTTPGIPRAYSSAVTSQLTVQLIPPPSMTGTLESIVVSSGATLDTTADVNTGVLMGIPEDLVWGVKYGALADLLADEASADPQRAAECEAYYQLAVALGMHMPVVLNAKIGEVPIIPSSLAVLDLHRSGWQGKNRGTPDTVAIVGPDLVAIANVPAGINTVTLDVIRTAKVPANDAAYIELGKDSLEAVLGMAQHLLTFKVGGAEHAATQALNEQFFAQAERYATIRSAAATSLAVMRGTTAQHNSMLPWRGNPRMVEDEEDVTRLERNARRRPFRGN